MFLSHIDVSVSSPSCLSLKISFKNFKKRKCDMIPKSQKTSREQETGKL